MDIQDSLRSLLEVQFGVKTRYHINRIASTVGTSATKLVNNDPKRIGLTIVNLSASDMYVAPDNLASSSRGIFVGAYGGNMSLVWNEDFGLLGNEWWAVAGSASSDVYVVEVLLI